MITPDRLLLEQSLRQAWSDVLGIQPSIDNNFFEDGGDSLSAVELSVRYEEYSGHELPLAMLFSSGNFKDILDSCLSDNYE